MSTHPTNRATWQDKPGVNLSIRSTPYPSKDTLEPNQLIIKSQAWAVNPADVAIQSVGLPFITYPLILGEDNAGIVVAAGSAASSKFKPNDRIIAVATGPALGKAEQSGFQEYVIVDAGLACHIPNFISFAEASVFPLALATSMHGLFSKDFLALPYPKADQAPTSTGKSVLIWGGSSAVGSNAIQLARAAGLEVFATGSPRNFDYLRRLGADKVFDYSSPGVVNEVVSELDRTSCMGIWQAAGSPEPCFQISREAKADLYVATATPIPEGSLPEGVRAKMVFGTTLTDNETGPGIFGDFLPKALAQRKYHVAPEPVIMKTKGLEGIQEGFDTLKGGVSAKKVVIVAE